MDSNFKTKYIERKVKYCDDMQIVDEGILVFFQDKLKRVVFYDYNKREIIKDVLKKQKYKPNPIYCKERNILYSCTSGIDNIYADLSLLATDLTTQKVTELYSRKNSYCEATVMLPDKYVYFVRTGVHRKFMLLLLDKYDKVSEVFTEVEGRWLREFQWDEKEQCFLAIKDESIYSSVAFEAENKLLCKISQKTLSGEKNEVIELEKEYIKLKNERLREGKYTLIKIYLDGSSKTESIQLIYK